MALTKIDDRGLKTPIDLLDDEKIRLGTGNDLELYHTGSHGYILNKTGNLVIRAKDGETGIEVIPDGAVELRHDNVKKFETTSTGTTTTGKSRIEGGATARSIDVVTTHGSGGEIASFQNSDAGNYGGLVVSGGETDRECRLESAFGSSYMTFYTQTASAEAERLRITSDGLVGIGLTSPGSYSSGANNLVVNDASGAGGITIVTPSSDTGSLFFSDGTGATGQGRVRNDHSTDQLTFGTNGTGSRMVIDSSGRVLIGTTTEGHGDADNLTINDTRAGITLRSANDNYGNIYFSDATSGAGEYAGYIQYNHTANRFVIGTNSADEIVIQSGGGISFNGEIAAANALNDYEEGVVTATVANSVTLHSTHDSFSYTKVGRLVTLMGQLRVNSDNSNSVFTITNIPFTSADLTEHADHAAGACRIWSWDINVADHVGVMAFLGGGSTTLDFYVNRDGQSAESLPASAGGYIGFSITYTAA